MKSTTVPTPTPPSSTELAADAILMLDSVAAIEHFRAIVQSSEDAIISKTLDGTVTSWNPGATAIFGYTAEEMIGQSLLRLFPPALIMEESLILERILDGQKVEHFETVRVHKHGHLIHVAVTISPIRDSNGQIIGASKIARNISERVRFEAISQQFETIVSTSDDAIVSKTLNGIVNSWNASAERIFGYSASEMIGRSIEVLLPPDRKDEERLILDKLRKGERIDHFETQRLRKDGRIIHVSVTISPLRDASGQVIGASKIARDITGRKAVEARLQLISSVFTHTSEAVAITDAVGTFLDVNDAFIVATGYAREEVLGRDPFMFHSSRQGPEVYQKLLADLQATGHCRGEVWSRRKSGEAFSGLLTVNRVGGEQGMPVNHVAIFADITSLREHQERLEHLVNFDPLTGLPNRLLLSDRLRHALAHAKRDQSTLAVAYLDLDGFKEINDRHGHDTGDRLLIALAERMQFSIRDVDTLARMGGDEFVAVLTDIGSTQQCLQMLGRILEACSKPVGVDGKSLQVSGSLGVTFYPQDDSDADKLMRHADQAMYEAKQAGKNRVHMFDLSRDSEIKSRFEIFSRIEQAFTHQEFRLHFQPKVNMRTGALIGLEALVRWHHPRQGVLSPAAFLPLIEDHALIESLGDWVIEAALTQMDAWRSVGLNVPVSINIAARQFRAKGFARDLAERVALHPAIAPSSLELELVETSALADIEEAVQTMVACRALGFHFAIDDFGTGYSSLTYLKRLPAQTLKIDQSFVRDMLDDHENLAIVKGIIGLADAFNRTVIAEGVESVAHGEKLLALGCELAQGHVIAKPMPGPEIVAWLASWQPPAQWKDGAA